MSQRYPIEFIKYLAESALKSLGMGESVINVQISDDREIVDNFGTELRHLTIKGGFIDFEIHEVVEVAGTAIDYQPIWSREIPGRGMNPPEEDIRYGSHWTYPSQAINEGIMRCVQENIEDACTDQQAYNDWKEEQGASNES